MNPSYLKYLSDTDKILSVSDIPLHKASTNKLVLRRIKPSVGGWTLIELLVVILLLGVLLAISIQALSDSRSSSRDAGANAMVKVLNQAQSRAYLANESPYVLAPVTNPDTGVVISGGIPGALYPTDDLDIIYWYKAKGLILPTQINTNVFELIERHPVPPSADDATGIWRRVP
jgi:prepilin-type N-terminal cleavage/methylation domain-containing protein